MALLLRIYQCLFKNEILISSSAAKVKQGITLIRHWFKRLSKTNKWNNSSSRSNHDKRWNWLSFGQVKHGIFHKDQAGVELTRLIHISQVGAVLSIMAIDVGQRNSNFDLIWIFNTWTCDCVILGHDSSGCLEQSWHRRLARREQSEDVDYTKVFRSDLWGKKFLRVSNFKHAFGLRRIRAVRR